MERFRKKQYQLAAAVGLILLVGTLGYYVIEDGWTLLDSFYMVAITITTVGFGEIHTLSPAGRIFTVLLVFAGLGMAATFATQLGGFLIENEFKDIFGRRKMQDRIRKISGHYVVVGHGRTGRTICLKLHEHGIPFVVVEQDPEALEQATRRGYLAVEGNAASDVILLSAGIERAAGVVTCIPDDAATMFITLAARELNPGINIIAQGGDPAIESRMIRAGADIVVYPLKLGGEQIAGLIARQHGGTGEVGGEVEEPGVLGYHLQLLRHYGEGEVTVGEILERSGALRAVALRTAGGEVVENPPPESKVMPEDALVILLRVAAAEEAGAGKGAEAPRPEAAWTEELETGVPRIDEQHRTLVLTIADFEKALARGTGRKEVAKLFDRLLDYTVEHFGEEERLMKAHDYPGMDRQVSEHRAFTRHVMELNRDKRYVFPGNVAEFLNTWLRRHIMEIDKDLGRYLKERGVA